MEKAVSLLTRATELDKAQRYSEALILYQEGIQMLMESMKGVKSEDDKQAIRTKIDRWMRRAERVKNFSQKEKDATVRHEQVHIEEGETGYDYPRIFERVFQGPQPTSVEVDDAYIRSKHQVTNFLRFCEFLVLKGSVKAVKLQTGREEPGTSEQEEDLGKVATSLLRHNITLSTSFSSTLHDREIRFDNGWVVKIGRGLDVFKPPKGRFSIGFCEMQLRQCVATTIDYYFRPTKV